MTNVETHGPKRPTRPSRGLTAMLASLAALGPLSTNIILPSFQPIGATLQVSLQQLGLTVSVFLVVFAFGQLCVGPLSDRFGRRSLIVGGLMIFVIGSTVCALADNFAMLVLGRAIQAVGVCAASVLARAIARDLFEGETLGRVLAMTIVAMAAAPGFSPLLGGLAGQVIGWRATFGLVGLLGISLAVWYSLRLGETHPPSQRAPLALGAVMRAYAELFADVRFIRPAGAVGLLMGALYGYFAAAPAVLMGQLGFTALQLGLFFAGTVPVVFAAGLLVPRLAHRWGADRITRVGLLTALAGGLLVLVIGLHGTGVVSFTLTTAVFLFGMGLANPLGTALALSPFAAKAGTASAMLGFLQMTGATVGATLITRQGATPVVTLGAVMSLLMVCSIAAFGLRRKRAGVAATS